MAATPTRAPATSSASRPLASWHGIGPAGEVRFGVCSWFGDVLVRFGYDLFEHEHPWDGEWIDDAFEASAMSLRSTGAKLVRALQRVAADDPLSVDLAVFYLRSILDDVAVCIPNCSGVEGRALPRGDLGALGFAPPDVLSFPTHSTELFPVIDGAGDRPALPKAVERVRAESAAATTAAVASLEHALVVLCPWFDGLLLELQRRIAARAEDGPDLLDRWSATDWSVIGRFGEAPFLPVL
jgi:hypothetical protein